MVGRPAMACLLLSPCPPLLEQTDSTILNFLGNEPINSLIIVVSAHLTLKIKYFNTFRRQFMNAKPPWCV